MLRDAPVFSLICSRISVVGRIKVVENGRIIQ
nr:MAG TPA: hypothetical protein [Caudoviricetes sp.]